MTTGAIYRIYASINDGPETRTWIYAEECKLPEINKVLDKARKDLAKAREAAEKNKCSYMIPTLTLVKVLGVVH